MRRYADTFFRYWILAILPILIIPLGALVLTRSVPTVYGTANLWVDQTSNQILSYVDPNLAPSTNMANYVSQLLLSESFAVGVVQQSPLYAGSLSVGIGPVKDRAAADLSKNAQVTTAGPNLVTVSYVSKNYSVAVEVVNGILKEASREIRAYALQQASKDTASYERQLAAAQSRYAAAAQSLGTYMSDHGILGNQLDLRQLSDPKLAALYQAVQSAQSDVTNAQQQLSKVRSKQAVPAAFRVKDAPAAKVSAPSRTKKITSLIIPMVLALLLSGAFIVLKTALDRSVRYADEVPALLDLPVLAVIPYTQSLANRSRRQKLRHASVGQG